MDTLKGEKNILNIYFPRKKLELKSLLKIISLVNSAKTEKKFSFSVASKYILKTNAEIEKKN